MPQVAANLNELPQQCTLQAVGLEDDKGPLGHTTEVAPYPRASAAPKVHVLTSGG